VNGEAPKVTRARMIIEWANGSARYYEARDPEQAEVIFEPLPEDAGIIAPRAVTAVGLRIAGGPPWHVRIEPASGEIPPELAERAAEAIDAFEGRLIVEELDHPLLLLRPYLARIAGRQA